MEIIKPKKLQQGDTVAVVSPSGFVPKELRAQFDKGVKSLEDLGLKIKLGKNCLKQYYYASGTVKERVDDIHTAFTDKEVKALIMSIGGASANHLLDSLDYNLIKKNPKVFCGISDGTTLLNPIFTKTGLITFHGPDLVFTFGMPMSSAIKENLMETLFESKSIQLNPNPDWKGLDKLNKDEKYKGWQCIRKGDTRGRLTGGNTSCLIKLENTDFRPDYKNTILFLEAFCVSVEDLHQQLTQMRQSGIFDDINGLILGYFYGSHIEDKTQDRRVSDVALEVTRDYSFPILEIGEVGHNVENYLLPIGCEASIDAGKKHITIDEPPVI